MLGNHQSLPQYAEHDLEGAQWHDDAWDQTTNCRFTPMLSPEPRFAQQPDESHQQGPGKYLRHEKILTNNSGVKGKGERSLRNLTSQHLTDRFNDTNKKGVAFFKVHDSGHQTRHFILKCGYLFHKAARFAGLVQSNLRLMLH
jgi:hypothetical protein